MSFGLQALFFWAVFLQRKNLSESLIGIATGPGAPGRDNALRLVALYAGARTVGRPLRGLRRSGGATAGASTPPTRALGSHVDRKDEAKRGSAPPPPRSAASHSAPVGRGRSSVDRPIGRASGPVEGGPSSKRGAGASSSRKAASPTGTEPPAPGPKSEDKRGQRRRAQKAGKDPDPKAQAAGKDSKGTQPARRSPASADRPDATARGHASPPDAGKGDDSLGAELRQERDRGARSEDRQAQPEPRPDAPASPQRRGRRRRKGPER